MTQQEYDQLKVGDIIIPGPDSGCDSKGNQCRVTGKSGGTVAYHDPSLDHSCEKSYQRLIVVSNSSNNKPMTNLEKFKLAFMSEPDKSLRKMEITNGDNMLTKEGSELYLNWKFQQDKDAFKKEVVDPMIEEEKKNK